MLDFVPVSMVTLFVAVTILTLGMLYGIMANARSKRVRRIMPKVIIGLSIWLLVQMFLTLLNVYNSNTSFFPPLIVLLGVVPALSFVAWLLLSPYGQKLCRNLSVKELTVIQIIRIPVELSLFFLYELKALPKIMTFDGLNFDILIGLSAPIIALIAFRRNNVRRKLLLVWNFIGLAFLLNIVVIAILSVPTPIQLFGFERPNVAVLNFPFSWLPTFIVPVVLFSHLVSIWKLLTIKKLHHL